MTKANKKIRLERKLEKQAKKKEKSARLSTGIEIKDKYIRSAIIPIVKKEVHSSSPVQYKHYYFSWCFKHSDTDGEWSWAEPRQWSQAELDEMIRPHMDSLTGNSWQDVETLTYNGKKGFRKLLNKYQPLGSICKEAQERWTDLEPISDYDGDLFRLRLGSYTRIWGFRLQHHFFLIWYERNHKICPI